MPDSLDSVKALAANYRRWSKDSDGENASKAKRQAQNADDIESVIQELEAARKRLRPISSDLGDLSDLPEELMSQLNLTKVDELEQQLRDIIASATGAEIVLDQILIELYRRHKVIGDRRFIMNKLYRMGKSGTIMSVEGRKGVYCLPQAAQVWPSKKGTFVDELDDDIPF